jgi:Flp pilus assembly pilin Flp
MLAMFEPDGNPPIAIAIFPANLIEGESGVTAIEYGLIAALIVIASVALNSVSTASGTVAAML